MLKYILFIKLLSLSSLVYFILFNQSSAQEDTTKFSTEEIIVTGTRVEQKIIDIPYSVHRIDQSAWKSSRKIGVNDVLTTIPGLFLQSRYGNHDVRVTIRGFGSRSNSGIRGVRILLDGVPESEPDGQTRIEAIDFTSIGRIELVKGNSSSLYTNAPGGVINFLTDKYFTRTFALTENEFGSYELRKNGVKFGVNSNNSRFMLTTSYENYKGYRNHSQQYQSRLNSVYEANITEKSIISAYGYYVNGLIKLPGALKLSEYVANDTMANSNSVSRDEKRLSKKGRLGLTFQTLLGKNDNNKLEVTGYGTIKDLERTSKTYRIITRYGLGGTFKYINKFAFGKKKKQRTNEFSIGGDFFYQTGPLSEFDNINGQKGDELKKLNDETITNVGFYALNQFPIIPERLSLLVTGRYDRVRYAAQNLQASFQDTSRLFQMFTPKFALNFKLTKRIAIYSSFGLSFDSPAFNEMDNYPYTSDGGLHLINPDIMPQKSTNFELGMKGDLPGVKKFFNYTFVELTFYNSKIKDAIVPFTVDNDAFFRNAAVVNRTGLEFGLSTEIIKGLTLKTAYTYQKFKYDEYKAGIIDSAGNFSERDFSGNIEPSNPDNFLSTDLMYQYTIKDKYTLFARTNFQYTSSMFVDDANTDSLKTNSYKLLNGQIGIDINFNLMRILAYGGLNNITNEKYVAFINTNSNRSEFYEAGPRRNFFAGLTLAYIFK